MEPVQRNKTMIVSSSNAFIDVHIQQTVLNKQKRFQLTPTVYSL